METYDQRYPEVSWHKKNIGSNATSKEVEITLPHSLTSLLLLAYTHWWITVNTYTDFTLLNLPPLFCTVHLPYYTVHCFTPLSLPSTLFTLFFFLHTYPQFFSNQPLYYLPPLPLTVLLPSHFTHTVTSPSSQCSSPHFTHNVPHFSPTIFMLFFFWPLYSQCLPPSHHFAHCSSHTNTLFIFYFLT